MTDHSADIILSRPAIVAVSQVAIPLAEQIAMVWPQASLYINKKHDSSYAQAIRYQHFSTLLQDVYSQRTPLIVIAATGIVIRSLAAVLQQKMIAPPVIVVSIRGDYIVPLLGAHHGARNISEKLSIILGAPIVHTDASEDIIGVALDEPPIGYVLDSPKKAVKPLSLANNEKQACIDKNINWLKESALQHNSSASLALIISQDTRVKTNDTTLVYRAKRLCIGIGAVRFASLEPFIEVIDAFLHEHSFHPHTIAGIFSINVKADEKCLHALAQHYKCQVGFFSAERLLMETERLSEKSDIVFEEVGCYGVAEAAAFAACNAKGKLIQPKKKIKAIGTMACVESHEPVDFASISDMVLQGRLSVIGIGPGSHDWRSIECINVIEDTTDLVGYEFYLSFLQAYHTGRTLHKFSLGQEQERVRHAITLAAQGKNVGLICSGDAGIYAMASLVFEELHTNKTLPANAAQIAIQIIPGISAMQAAAARAGAPLGHDFCAISLSDLLTPTEIIKRRIDMALEADFVMALYNPVSQKRHELFRYVIDRTKEVRGEDCVIIVARQLGRNDEKVVCIQLNDFEERMVDMLTIVIIGNSQSQLLSLGYSQQYAYTPRGYENKKSG